MVLVVEVTVVVEVIAVMVVVVVVSSGCGSGRSPGGLIIAGYLPLASQNLYPIIAYSIAML